MTYVLLLVADKSKLTVKSQACLTGIVVLVKMSHILGKPSTLGKIGLLTTLKRCRRPELIEWPVVQGIDPSQRR